jgi:hypothetical protein
MLSYVYRNKSFHQRGDVIMSEKQKRINVEMVEGLSNITPQASIYWVDQFFRKLGISKAIDDFIGARKLRGAKDSDHIKAMTVSQLCGSDTIEDQKTLPCRVGILGIKIPSVSATRDYMRKFHNYKGDRERGMGRNFIPEDNEYLSGFARIHEHVFKEAYKLNPLKSITLDQDATLIPAGRPEACFNCEGERSYGAFNTYCLEYGIMVGTRYSDGNVTAGHDQLGELKRVLSYVPDGVKKVSLRSDSAGYQVELMKYCASGSDERFGVINFGISCDAGREFKDAAKRVPESDWRPLRKEAVDACAQECAEVSYAPNALSRSKKDPEIRFFAIREPFRRRRAADGKAQAGPIQKELDFQMAESHIEELESSNVEMKKLHLTVMDGKAYKVFGAASSILDKPGDEIITRHRGRCGKSEQAHDILKNDFGGGHVPSHLFGVNAAWWNIAVLAMNVSNMLKMFFLPEGFKDCRMKKLRHVFFTLAGKVITHARRTVLRIWSGDTGSRLLIYALSALDRLMPCRT